jgi:hypothetical protein
VTRDAFSSFEKMPTAELVRLRTDLRIFLALAAPGSAVAVPAERQLRAIASVLAAREHESTSAGDWQHRENPLAGGAG